MGRPREAFDMAYCSGCGKNMGEGVTSCSVCGHASKVGADASAAVGATPTEPEVVTQFETPIVQASWAALQTQGTLVLAESAYEYAVYDGTATFGRWPKTGDGLRYASESFGAHSQSLAHGIAYETTGYQDPARLGLPTTPVLKSQTYASPMSYVGSTRRMVGWAGGVAKRSPGMAALGWTVAAISLLIMWSLVTVWYVIIYGLFGIFVIPYRLMRRSQRKSQHVQRTTLATQQAMLRQMAQSQPPLQHRPIVQPPPPAMPPPASQLPPS